MNIVVSQDPWIFHGITTSAAADVVSTTSDIIIVIIVVVLFGVDDTDDVECSQGDHVWCVE